MTNTTAATLPAHVTAAGIQAVLFDLDGTLVDTVADFDVALNHMLQKLALPPITQQEIRLIIGKGSIHLIQTVLARKLAQAGQPADQAAVAVSFNAAWDAYMDHYIAINGQYASVYQGVLPSLQQLRQAGLRLAVVTNKPLALATPLMRVKQLEPYVEFLYGGDSFERKKPDPYPLLQACERLGTSPAQTLMIGDSSNDAQAARAAGCPVVLLRYGYNHGEPIEQADADACFDSMEQIVAQLLPSVGRGDGQQG